MSGEIVVLALGVLVGAFALAVLMCPPDENGYDDDRRPRRQSKLPACLTPMEQASLMSVRKRWERQPAETH